MPRFVKSIVYVRFSLSSLNSVFNMKSACVEIAQDVMPDLAMCKFHDDLIRIRGAWHVGVTLTKMAKKSGRPNRHSIYCVIFG